MTYKATFKCTQCGHIYEGLVMEGDSYQTPLPRDSPAVPSVEENPEILT